MLALGSDEKLKKLAIRELEGNPDADGQVALGDGWWELASESEGKAKEQIEGRAGHWYRKALPGLTGLMKDRVEKRLVLVRDSKVEKQPTAKRRTIDLLRLVDPRRHIIEGSWQHTGRALVVRTNKKAARIGIPCMPRSSYQLRVVFVRSRGDNTVGVVLPVGTASCLLAVSSNENQFSGIRDINGAGIPQNRSHTASRIVNNRKYELTIDVRLRDQQAEITAYVNGEPHVRWEGPQKSLSVPKMWRIPQQTLGLVAVISDVVFYEVVLIETDS